MNQKLETIIQKLSDEDAAVVKTELQTRFEEREQLLDENDRLSSELSYTKGKLNTAVVGLKDLLHNVDEPWRWRDTELGGRGAEGHAKVRARMDAMDEQRKERAKQAKEQPDEPSVDPKADYHTPDSPEPAEADGPV